MRRSFIGKAVSLYRIYYAKIFYKLTRVLISSIYDEGSPIVGIAVMDITPCEVEEGLPMVGIAVMDITPCEVGEGLPMFGIAVMDITPFVVMLLRDIMNQC